MLAQIPTFAPPAQVEGLAIDSLERIVSELGLFGLVSIGIIAIMFMIMRRNVTQEKITQDAIRTNMKTLDRVFEDLSRVRDELDTERQARIQEVSSNQTSIRRFEEQINNAFAQRDIARKERDKLQIERDQVLFKLETLTLRVDELSKQIDDLKVARKSDAERMLSLTQERDEAITHAKNARHENETLRERIRQLEEQSNHLTMLMERIAPTEQFKRSDIMNDMVKEFADKLSKEPLTPLIAQQPITLESRPQETTAQETNTQEATTPDNEGDE